MNEDDPKSELPPTDSIDWVQLTTARTVAEGSVIVALLEDEDIPAMISGCNANNSFAGLSVFDVRVRVPRSLEQKALEVLAQIQRGH